MRRKQIDTPFFGFRTLYFTISDQDLPDAIDMMKFDVGKTDIRVKE